MIGMLQHAIISNSVTVHWLSNSDSWLLSCVNPAVIELASFIQNGE